MVTSALILQMVGGAGFLAGVAGVLQYIRDRTRIRAEVARDVAEVVRAIEAPRAMVRFAKGYEAKWGVAYSHNGTDPASYVVTGVRKAPARRSR